MKKQNKYNIFQGRNGIREVIEETLKIEKYPFGTADIYFTAFFYLTKRFGLPYIIDDYKDVGNWLFSVKQYTIIVYINTSFVEFMIFGKGQKNITLSKSNFNAYSSLRNTPYRLKYQREWKRKRRSVFSAYKPNQKVWRKVLEYYLVANNIPDNKEAIGLALKDMNQFHAMNDYNNSVINVKQEDYEQYGEYSNSKTRHALRTLRQFLHNMLTPIRVRDCAFNIKGRLSDQEDADFDRWKNNIEIKFTEPDAH